jgi:MFS family permease
MSTQPDALIPHQVPPHGIYKWLVVAMLWLVCFFNYADRQAIFSVFPLIQRDLHLTDLQLGVVATSFMVLYALVGPFAGTLADRLPRKSLILTALLFWSLVTAATALTRTYPQLVLCRALGGLGEAFYFPAAMSLLGDYHTPATRSRAMSIHQSSVYVGTIAGGAISGLTGQLYGWRTPFTLFGAAGILLALILLTTLREPPRTQPETPTPKQSALPTLAAVLRNRLALTLIAAFTGANFVAVVFLTWTPTFLVRKFHMSLALAGLNATV